MHYLYRMSAAFLVLTFAIINDSGATVIFQQLPGPESNTGVISSARNADGNLPGYHVADNFILEHSARITDVHWWGSPLQLVPLLPGGTDFQFIFYADNGGLPGAILHTTGGSLASATVNVGSPLGQVRFYSSDIDSPFNAEGGSRYWLSIFNEAPDASWEWLTAEVPGDGSSLWINAGSPCCIFGQNMAFELTVPEPGSFAILGTALAGFGAIWRRRRIKV